jgi:hypothetical protein
LEIDRNVHEILKNKITESFSKFFEDALWYASYQFLEKIIQLNGKRLNLFEDMRRLVTKFILIE